MENDPIGNDSRNARRRRRIGDDDTCVRCLLVEPEVMVMADRHLLEGHHVLGEVHDDQLLVPLCPTCHVLVTHTQQNFGADLRRNRAWTLPERIAAALRSLAAFLKHLYDRLCRWAESLDQMVDQLDQQFPAWRDLPAATWS